MLNNVFVQCPICINIMQAMFQSPTVCLQSSALKPAALFPQAKSSMQRNDEICQNTYIKVHLIPWSKHVKLHISMKDSTVITGVKYFTFYCRSSHAAQHPPEHGRRKSYRSGPGHSYSLSNPDLTFKKNIINDYYVTYISTNDISHILRCCCYWSVIGPGTGSR